MRFKPQSILSPLTGFALLLLAISNWFPLGIHPLELLAAFAHFTLILSITAVVISIAFRLRILMVSALAASIISGALVFPHFESFESETEPNFTIGQFNLYHNNPSPEQVLVQLTKNSPDIVVVQEQNADWSPLIDSLFKQSHPYTVEVPTEECCYGIGLFSKFPVVSYDVFDLENTPAIIAQILVKGRELTVVSFHTRPPAFPDQTDSRNAQLNTIAKLVSHDKNPCLVLGDFNIVPWDRTFKDFLKVGKLTAVRDGFQATYPMDFGFPLIPIDHITYSEGLTPTTCETVKLAGSDHKGLIAGFAFAD